MDRFSTLYTKMKSSYNRGNYEEALRQLYAMPRKVIIPEEKRWMYHQAMGMCLFSVGNVNDALRHLATSLQNPGDMPLDALQRTHSNYAMYLHYLPGVTDEEIRDVHFRYGQLFQGVDQFSHEKRKKQKLRIGYLSPDIGDHIVMSFAVQLFAQYDRERFEAVIYNIGKQQNEVTDWLCNMVNGSRNLSELTAEDAARRIYADGVDILFDLAGHTAGGATLQIAAYRPAPVQISGIGYFNTTGLPAMDYFLSDPYCDPPENDALFAERLIRLPHSHFCFTPSERFRGLALDPGIHEPLTFGSFNNFSKVTDEMLLLWKKILSEVPGSRLVLKNVSPLQEPLERMRKRCQELGLEQATLRPGTHHYEKDYMDIDIALDTYPYPGGGTTCEALYLGIPVISLYGQRHGSRFGYSLLENAGIGELAARTENDYVETAIALARDPSLLHALHVTLPHIMKKSPLMDAKNYVHEVEAAYEEMWRAWMEG